MLITPCKPKAQLGVENGALYPTTPQGLNFLLPSVVHLRSTGVERCIFLPRAALHLHGVITGLSSSETGGGMMKFDNIQNYYVWFLIIY